MRIRPLVVCALTLLLLTSGACKRKGRPDAPRGEPGGAAAQSEKPLLVSPEGTPFKVARQEQAIVIRDLNAGQTYMLFRPKAAYLNLNGRRMTWSEGSRVYYCDLPGGAVRRVDSDADAGPTASHGNVLAYGCRAGIRVHDLADGSRRDLALPHVAWLYLNDQVVAGCDAHGTWSVKYAKLDTGEIVDTKLKDRQGAGLAFADGAFAFFTRISTGKGSQQHQLVWVDTVTGEIRRPKVDMLLGAARFVGDEIFCWGGPRGNDTALRLLDMQRLETTRLFEDSHFSTHYGLDSNGRQVAWGYNETRVKPDTDPDPGNKVTVWLWEPGMEASRNIAAEAHADMPGVERVVPEGGPPVGGADAMPQLTRELGYGSVHIGDGFVVWTETWNLSWRVPAR